MKPANEDYELAARWLDGEAVELTGRQRALVDEIAVDAEAVGLALDVRLPPGTLHRVAAGLRPVRPQARVLKWRITQAVAAAAVIAVALGMLWLGGRVAPPPPEPAAGGEGPDGGARGQVEYLIEAKVQLLRVLQAYLGCRRTGQAGALASGLHGEGQAAQGHQRGL